MEQAAVFSGENKGRVRARKIAEKRHGNVLFWILSPDYVLFGVSIQLGIFRLASWVWIL